MNQTDALILLSNKLDERFDKIDRQFDQIDERFRVIDSRFDAIDQRFEKVDEQFEKVEARLDNHERTFEKMFQAIEVTNQRLADHIVESRRQHSEIYAAILELSVRVRDHDQELLTLSHHTDRHERWHHEIADHVRARLTDDI